MIAWLARGLLLTAGLLASWFIAGDAPQFSLMQAAIAVLLLVLIVAVLALWPDRWTAWLNRVHK